MVARLLKSIASKSHHKLWSIIGISISYSATGPALREKIYTMQNLYQKYKSTGLEEAETNNLLQIRKLLQLKTLVTTLLNDNRYPSYDSYSITVNSGDFEHFIVIFPSHKSC